MVKRTVLSAFLRRLNMTEDEAKLAAVRQADEASLLAEHKSRVAVLPPIIITTMGALVDLHGPAMARAKFRQINRDNAAHARAVSASCREYAKQVHAMRARHVAAENE